ncbi:D-alanyl-D-alanine carboxypeptidase/D-alanyl-D-alanine-endopeptidase [Rhodobacterales bacterium HKCCE3408]|nr:D-alanyl-D-alanine carboxypeptidase/D-alanyl-D-alanine-endopeptidase [Rhodobacterales bacterium HKCCE3408]
MVSRRFFLAATVAGLARAATAGAPGTSLLPSQRPDGLWRQAAPTVEQLLEEAGLGGRVGFAVADARTGELLEVRAPLYGMPPASVAKSVTCAYALDRLGPGYRFRTRLLAAGPVTNGRLDGDLWLVGGGDPVLVTDDLNDMARQLAEIGLREVTGQLRIAAGPLPGIHEIDPEQPPHVGYNPAVGDLNLNFNRVHFEWTRTGNGYDVSMDARSESIRPAVTRQRMRVEDRQGPVYTYSEAEGREDWTVARGALGESGARWLPVRNPALYTAEVLQVLCRSRGLVLEGPEQGGAPPEDARVMAEHVSEPLEDILGGMMEWSTNITAEAVGLLATRAGGTEPESLAHSAAAMTEWMKARLGARNPHFVDHSGLGEASRIPPGDMVRALVSLGADGLVRRLMKTIPMRDDEGNLVPDHPISVVAKTGTLNFVSCLAGYAETPGGRDLAFGIFCADLPRRQALTEAEMERPPGGRSYSGRARRLQQQLIERWALVYG